MARDYSLKGLLFASAATTVIPTSPVTGVPYRNASLTSGIAGNGWPFGVIVDSADFNEMMYKITSLLDYIEKTGALVWSQYTDYVIGSLVRDDSFNFWEATAASGPNNGGYATPAIGSASWKIAKFNFYGGGEKIVFNTTNYTAAANDCVFCRNGGITVSMPASPKNNDRIRIVTSSAVGSSSTVTISSTKIQQTGITTILMDQPNSIVELVYDEVNSMWILGSTIRGGHLEISGGNQLRFIAPVSTDDMTGAIGDHNVAIDAHEDLFGTKADTELSNLTLATALSNLGFVQSIAANGYLELPGGIVIQWGTITPTVSGPEISDANWDTYKQAFPVPFPTSCLALVATRRQDTLAQGIAEASATLCRYTNSDYYVIDRSAANRPFTWIAIGY